MPSPSRRIYSPSHRAWVDILVHGEIAMSASKLEFITSFTVEGVNSFTLINGECHFQDDNIFILWNSYAILIYYINNKEALHITVEEMDPPCTTFAIKNIESHSPMLEIYRNQETERRELKNSMQLFKLGRGLV